MDPFNISYLGAFTAGILSFVSPCVLPLIPAYLCFLGGSTLDELTAKDGINKAVQRKVFLSALFFVLGFSSVFVALGATATTLSAVLAENMGVLSKFGGVVIIIFGLHYMGIFKIGFLNFEKRVHIQNKPSGFFGSYVLGLAFAFGWTPCVGPILATILMVAAGSDSVWFGVRLLAVYAAGIGIPFLLAAFAVKPFMTFMGRFRRHLHKVEIAIGVLLILTGIAIFTGSLADASQWILETFPSLGEQG
ncbi:cytochrome c biogenesis CcdA family protein [Varunaivibrio sulfuroxidans]|uniref:Cytochrome c-type biogenesis protein n=1 Tax=Varunaivibrio sulfuroxidans TaxID=1773489 RepID=A0A4V2UP30_9PROT|nr:cytochrome c biogenesis protein CcdA [Varunaivibrio sulfuroxidans]TCS64301.1 cytochrome c-type biogenesis protein [Varunaivibrio sulfuroxidans]WES31263.1 cytochrome c biogenesis protein CcdA [Varunaivibrio sulfuroxidans]